MVIGIAAGIACYWQLAQLSDADIKRVLQLTELQTDRMDFEQIRNDALALAKKSRSEGSVWTDEPPDDFGLIEGLGRTYERRLYDAGIWTYDRLSRSTADQVRRICDSQNARKLYAVDSPIGKAGRRGERVLKS